MWQNTHFTNNNNNNNNNTHLTAVFRDYPGEPVLER